MESPIDCDPGDDLATASYPSYGEDASGLLPPSDELVDDTEAPDYQEPADAAAKQDAGIFVSHDDKVEEMKAALGDFDYLADDGNWGIDAYCRVVCIATDYFAAME
ncbi:hypothetical protein DFH08DRAFT_803396 [Mycena albidolilacea]|uniref:Uncharacterized protein n=1 Tax=Mycena albidolilacea TaxID=1033008 RepID=A0AAD7ACR4_9AGAR|nr:hypothetical protein DFH08DRAFT_803396 [Mycena albidolilacea]